MFTHIVIIYWIKCEDTTTQHQVVFPFRMKFKESMGYSFVNTELQLLIDRPEVSSVWCEAYNKKVLLERIKYKVMGTIQTVEQIGA